MTNQSSLPLPRDFGWIAGGHAEVTTIYSDVQYTATATHDDDNPDVPVRVSLTPDDYLSGLPSIHLAFSAEQWATIFAVVASVAPRPVWSMTEELKRMSWTDAEGVEFDYEQCGVAVNGSAIWRNGVKYVPAEWATWSGDGVGP